MPITATRGARLHVRPQRGNGEVGKPLVGVFLPSQPAVPDHSKRSLSDRDTFAVLQSSIGPGSLSWMPTRSGPRAIAGTIASAGTARADGETIWSILAIAKRSLRLLPVAARGTHTSVSARFEVHGTLRASPSRHRSGSRIGAPRPLDPRARKIARHGCALVPPIGLAWLSRSVRRKAPHSPVHALPRVGLLRCS
jgi:hypothetical protein